MTTPGTTATTSVWFPPGRWTDYVTGRTYTAPAGGATYDVTTLETMPVFVRAGAVLATRTDNVPHDAHSPLDKVSLTVPPGTPAPSPSTRTTATAPPHGARPPPGSGTPSTATPTC